jgi:TPR repeat protein
MRKVLILLFCLTTVLICDESSKIDEFNPSKIESYKKECTNKVANSCFYLGIAHFLGNGLSKNDSKAIEFFQQANSIEPNNTLYITAIARVYYHNYKTNGGDALINGAMKLFDAACKLKDAASCYELGEIYNYDSSKRDYSKASSYYKQSCNLKNADGCLKLGSLKNK